MTRDQIMTLEGRELDVAVAEHVMGWTQVHVTDEGLLVGHDPGERRGDNVLTVVPRYSTDIAAAWQVVERMAKQTHRQGFCVERLDGKWQASMYYIGEGEFFYWAKGGETAPEAICRSALLTMFSDVREVLGGE